MRQTLRMRCPATTFVLPKLKANSGPLRFYSLLCDDLKERIRATPAKMKDPASVLMIDGGEEQSQAELMLQESDFPDTYVNMAHPNDYISTKTSIQPEFIDHEGIFGHHRLLLRVSFKLMDGMHVPFTFVVDTGAPFHFYLSDSPAAILKKGGRLLSDSGQEYVEILGSKALVHATPTTHKPGNIMGLKMIKKLGLHVGDSFSFSTPFSFF